LRDIDLGMEGLDCPVCGLPPAVSEDHHLTATVEEDDEKLADAELVDDDEFEDLATGLRCSRLRRLPLPSAKWRAAAGRNTAGGPRHFLSGIARCRWVDSGRSAPGRANRALLRRAALDGESRLEASRPAVDHRPLNQPPSVGRHD
jgi:hypothetical protein